MMKSPTSGKESRLLLPRPTCCELAVNGLVCLGQEETPEFSSGFPADFHEDLPIILLIGKPDVAVAIKFSQTHTWAIRLKGKYHKIAAILFYGTQFMVILINAYGTHFFYGTIIGYPIKKNGYHNWVPAKFSLPQKFILMLTHGLLKSQSQDVHSSTRRKQTKKNYPVW